MKLKIFVIGVLLIIIVFYACGFRVAGSWLVKVDKPVNADAIVMLMGFRSDRILQVSDLYKKGLSYKVIIAESGMGASNSLEERGVHLKSFSKEAGEVLADVGIPADSIIILPGEASSTQMEAVIISRYLAGKPDIKSILLVSSAPHIRRASMIFEAAFRESGATVSVFCSPSKYTDFNPKKWWTSMNGIQTVMLEYLKMANFFLFEREELRKEIRGE